MVTASMVFGNQKWQKCWMGLLNPRTLCKQCPKPYPALLSIFAINGTTIFKMNTMLLWRGFKNSIRDQELSSQMFTEPVSQVYIGWGWVGSHGVLYSLTTCHNQRSCSLLASRKDAGLRNSNTMRAHSSHSHEWHHGPKVSSSVLAHPLVLFQLFEYLWVFLTRCRSQGQDTNQSFSSILMIYKYRSLAIHRFYRGRLLCFWF